MKGISWLTLTLRWALGLLLGFGSFAYLTGWHFYVEEAGKVTPWIGIEPSHWYGKLLASLVLLAGVALLSGAGTILAAFTALVGVLLMHANALIQNPVYNTLNNAVPLFILGCATWTMAEREDAYGLDAWHKIPVPAFLDRRDEWISLFTRLFIGMIALRQGIWILFERGPILFALKNYVTPFAGHLPSPLLWLMGIANPFILAICGMAICLGLFTRFASGLYLTFLVSIMFGHLVEDPYRTGGNGTSHMLNNFFFAAIVFYRHAKGLDNFGIGTINLWPINGGKKTRPGSSASHSQKAKEVGI